MHRYYYLAGHYHNGAIVAKVMGASHGDPTRVGAAAASYLFAVVSRPDVGGAVIHPHLLMVCSISNIAFHRRGVSNTVRAHRGKGNGGVTWGFNTCRRCCSLVLVCRRVEA